MQKKKSIDDLRKKINILDGEIVKLLNERLEYAIGIGKIKKEKKLPFYDASRETEVIEKIKKLNKNFPEVFLKKIYTDIMAASRLAERRLRVIFLGPEGSFTHIAAKEKFPEAELISAPTIPAVFTEVEKNNGDFGVAPVENSNNGIVTHTLDKLLTTSLTITGEKLLKISHNLLSKEKNLKNISTIYSHSQSFGQCENWLSKNFGSKIKLIPLESNSRAAEIAAKTKNAAAIGSILAAEIYGLNILSENIEDFENNTTRFLIIGRQPNKKTQIDKTSIAFAAKDRVGILHKCLEPFAKRRINLSKIESRPLKNVAWNYVFFVDFIGNSQDIEIKKALEELDRYCAFIKILGSYPDGRA